VPLERRASEWNGIEIFTQATSRMSIERSAIDRSSSLSRATYVRACIPRNNGFLRYTFSFFLFFDTHKDIGRRPRHLSL